MLIRSLIFVKKPEIQGGDESALDVLSERPPREDTGTVYDDSDEEVYAAARRADEEEYGYGFSNFSSIRAEEADRLQSGHYEVAPLPYVDHNAFEYDEFNKDFYEESPEIAQMSLADVQHYRRVLGIVIFFIEMSECPQMFVSLVPMLQNPLKLSVNVGLISC